MVLGSEGMTEEFVVRSNRRGRVLPDCLTNRDAALFTQTSQGIENYVCRLGGHETTVMS